MGRALNIVFSSVFTIAAARILGPGEFGDLTLALAIVGIMASLFSFQLGVQAARTSESGTGPDLTTAWGISALATLGALLSVPLVRGWGPNATSTLLVMIPVVSSEPIIQFVTGRWYALQRGVRAAFTQTLPGVIRSSAAVVALSLPTRSAVTAGAAMGLASIGFLIGVPSLKPASDRVRRAPFTRTLRLGLVLGALAGNWLVLQRSDVLLVGLFESHEVVGGYAAAQRLFEVPLAIYAAAMTAFLAPVASVDERGLSELLAESAVIAGALLPTLALLGTWGGPAAALVFGPGFSLGPEVYALLALGAATHITLGAAGATLVGRGGEGFVARVAMGSVVFNLGTSLVLGRLLGASGVALATWMTYLAMNLVLVRRLGHRLRDLVRLVSPVSLFALVTVLLLLRLAVGATRVSTSLAVTIAVGAAMAIWCSGPRRAPDGRARDHG